MVRIPAILALDRLGGSSNGFLVCDIELQEFHGAGRLPRLEIFHCTFAFFDRATSEEHMVCLVG